MLVQTRFAVFHQTFVLRLLVLKVARHLLQIGLLLVQDRQFLFEGLFAQLDLLLEFLHLSAAFFELVVELIAPLAVLLLSLIVGIFDNALALPLRLFQNFLGIELRLVESGLQFLLVNGDTKDQPPPN
jgi:hypothetical protein